MSNRGIIPLLVMLSIVGEAPAQDGAEVVARWKHLGNTIALYSNGKINDPSGENTWSKAGTTLTFRWKDAKAPGGFWIDTCTIAPDGQSFKGTNQLKRPINGTLIKDAPAAKPAEKPEVVAERKVPAEAVAASNDVWKVLQLTSLEYELNFQKVPREHALPPFVPLLSSKTAPVREVAALSAQWEISVWDVQKAMKAREKSVTDGLFKGIPVPRPAGAAPPVAPPEVPASVEAALKKAKGDGLLTAFQLIDDRMEKVAGEDGAVGKMSQASAEFYRTQLVVALKQAVLWNKAEQLAKSVANGDNGRGNDLEVRGVFEPGKTWGTVVLRNKSATDLDHVTFTLLAPSKAMPPGSPALDFVLGTRATGDTKSGFNLQDAVVNDRDFNAMPVRTFVHIPRLAAGKECEVRLFRTSAEFGKTVAAMYSVWAERVAIEGKPLPGYQQAKSGKAAPGAGGKPADPKDPFQAGSVWRGTMKWTLPDSPDSTREAELAVTVRNGEDFKGTITQKFEGRKYPADIVGTVANGAIQFEHQTDMGKRGLLHTGTLKGTRVEFTYEEGGDKPKKSVTVLNLAPAGKR